MKGKEWRCIDGGILPENFIKPILSCQADLIILVDAVEMGHPAGTVRIIPEEYIRDIGNGSHQIPLTYLVSRLSSGVNRVILIGIQPQLLEPDTDLTPQVREAADSLINILLSGNLKYLPHYTPDANDSLKE
jgi:hydrogenase 3 maturation protease